MMRMHAVVPAFLAMALMCAAARAAEPTLKWTYRMQSAIRSSPAIEDIDGDGRQEVLIAGRESTLHCVGADGKAKWVFTLPFGSEVVSSASVGDLEGDGVLDILIGGSDGTLHCLRPNGELKWRVGVPNFIRRSVCTLADLDGDGKLEILVSGGHRDIFCLSAEGEVRWLVPTASGTGAPPLCADVNGDGRIETVATCYDGLIRCIDPEGNIIWQFESPDEVYSGPVAADLDGDGDAEVLVGSSAQFLYCLDGKSGRLVWGFDSGGIIDTAISLERTPDGIRIYCGNSKGNVYALNGAGRVLWRFDAGENVYSAAVVGDLDGDGESELVFGSQNSIIYMVSAATGALEWTYDAAHEINTSAGIADLEGDGKVEFVIGDESGRLYCFEGAAAGPQALVWPLRRLTNDGYASLLPREGRAAPAPRREVAVGLVPPRVGEPLQTGPVTISVVRTHVSSASAPLNLTAIAISQEARAGCRMRLTVIHDGEEIHTAQQRGDLRPGSTVFLFYLPQSTLPPDFYELSFDVTDEGGHRVGHATVYMDKVTEGRVRSDVKRARERLAHLGDLAGQVEAKGLDAAYPRVSEMVVEAFAQYALDDMAGGKLERAGHVSRVIHESLERGVAECNRLLSGDDPRRPAPRFAPGRVGVGRGMFRVEERPVLLVGGMGGGHVVEDTHRFPRYGMNCIGLEIGPAATLASLTEERPEWREHLDDVFARAKRSGVSVMWLLSPHYFPQWAYEQFPEVKTCGRGFLEYCILSPDARRVLEAHLRAVIPVLAAHPEFNSYCLANEPVFDEKCEHAQRFFQAWLREKYGTVAHANEVWGTNYPSVGAVPFDTRTENPAYHYDAIRAHNAMGTDFFRFMYDVIRTMDPYTPIHIKVMHEAFEVDSNELGIDREALESFCEINGCDAIAPYPGDAYAMGFPGQTMFYDLLRSFQPGKPVFNTEDHLIRDNDPAYYPPEFIRSAYWEAAMHGMGGSVIWVWERGEGSPMTTNNILTRPECTEAMGRTSLDLNRLGSAVEAFANKPTQAAILFSLPSRIQPGGEDYLAALQQAYEGGYFGGVYARFVSDRQIQAGGLDRFRLLILPQAANVEDATFRAIAQWAQGGGLVLMTAGSLRADEYDGPRDPALLEGLQAIRVPLPETPQAWAEALLRVARDHGLEIQQAAGPDGKPLWGVVLRRAGDWLYLLNYNRETVRVGLPAAEALDLVSGEKVSSPLALTPMRPVLVRVGG